MYGPILDYLRELGGEGTTRDVCRTVADRVVQDAHERNRLLKSGSNAVENEVAWARNNLREAGLIDGSTRGVWRLTDLGWSTKLDLQGARELGKHAKIVGSKLSPVQDELDYEDTPNEEGGLLKVLRALPPDGFEKLCRHVLQRAGFVDVEVTGKSGDGGIDGHGILQVNELVSFRVLFQCKRFQGAVSSPAIRDFRGTMSGRTDKGIFITTGHFSSEAHKEANRDGVAPIELVDGEKLVSLMERLEIGVRPRTVFELDNEFFKHYR